MLSLSDQELLRYDRQITLKGFDIDKQTQLKNQSAIIVGLGGLGCSAALYLCHSGIGKLTLIDFDVVALSNLNRQILYTAQAIAQPKVEVAKQVLLQHNPKLNIDTFAQKPDDSQLAQLIKKHDIVLDCTDNISTRDQINRCCFQQKKPLVSGAAIRMEGLLTVFTYQQDEPCYGCLSTLFGQEQLTCAESGIMAPLVGMVGAMQALETIKVLTHYGKPLKSRLLVIDAMTMQFNEILFTQQTNCPVCQHAHID